MAASGARKVPLPLPKGFVHLRMTPEDAIYMSMEHLHAIVVAVVAQRPVVQFVVTQALTWNLNHDTFDNASRTRDYIVQQLADGVFDIDCRAQAQAQAQAQVHQPEPKQLPGFIKLIRHDGTYVHIATRFILGLSVRPVLAPDPGEDAMDIYVVSLFCAEYTWQMRGVRRQVAERVKYGIAQGLDMGYAEVDVRHF